MKNLSVPFIHADNLKALTQISEKLDHIHNEWIHV